MMSYEASVPKIPHAAITLEEDASMMERMQARGETVRVRLKMEAQTLEPTLSRNVVAEIPGREFPEQVVRGVGGHIDSGMWGRAPRTMEAAWRCGKPLA